MPPENHPSLVLARMVARSCLDNLHFGHKRWEPDSSEVRSWVDLAQDPETGALGAMVREDYAWATKVGDKELDRWFRQASQTLGHAALGQLVQDCLDEDQGEPPQDAI